MNPWPGTKAFPVSATRPLSRILGQVTAAIGFTILIGWIADIPMLKSLFPHHVGAKANTAICFILAGAALSLKSGSGPLKRRAGSVLANLCAALTALIGLLTLAEYVFGKSLGIDQLLFTEPATALETIHPGRMALPAAFNFLLLGTALLLLDTRRAHVAGWLVLLPSAVAGLAFAGYLYDLPLLASYGPYTPMAAPTGITFLFLGAGVFLASGGRLVEWLQRRARGVGFISALAMLLLLGGAVVRNMHEGSQNALRVTHTHEVIDRLVELLSTLQDLETGARGYLLTGEEHFLEPHLPAPAAARRFSQELRGLTADNAAQQRRLDKLESLIDRKIKLTQSQVALRKQGDIEGARALANEGKSTMEEIRKGMREMTEEERHLLRGRQALTDASTVKTTLAFALGLLASLGLLLAIHLLLHREIAARVRIEADLRRSEENLSVTLHSIGDAVLATDTEGRITLMNGVAEKLTGWTLAEALDHPVDEVFRIINEETRESAVIPVDDVLATGKIHGLANHTIIIARDGMERPIADSAAPIHDRDGRILGVVLAFRDVTAEREAQNALRESEARYRTLFDSIDEGFCIIQMIFDEQGKPVDYRFLEINPSFEKQTGLRDAEGKRMRELAPKHEEHWFEIYGNIALSGEPLRFQNRAEQLQRSYDVYAFRFGEPKDRKVAILFNDITERKQWEQEVKVLNADLELRAAQLNEANKELEAFSYSVSHDLRAPLRHVQGYVQMLAREAASQLSDKGRRYLQTIEAASKDMGNLIDDLLSFSRMGQVEMHERAVALDGLLAESLRKLETATQGRNIFWKIAPLPAVMGDSSMLRQVFANLLGNAVKYSGPRDPAEIEVGCAGQEDGRVILFVRDNGVGFDPKYAHKLFGVFQRLHRADEFEGTGIGLANVRRIISRHGGRTWAEGKLGEGAAFFFTLLPAASQ